MPVGALIHHLPVCCLCLQASAASTVPGTPVDLSAEVQSCLELMRATRAQLADRLQHSQGVCEEMIAGCQQGAAGQDAEAVVARAPADSGAFGSPAPASPASPRDESPAVLRVSRRHHANVAHDASPSPPSKLSGESGWGGSSCSPSVSPRSDCGAATPRKVAQARVAEARARTTAWDLAGFVRSLGLQVMSWAAGGGYLVVGQPARARLSSSGSSWQDISGVGLDRAAPPLQVLLLTSCSPPLLAHPAV